MLAMVSGGFATFGCLSRTGDGEMSIPLEMLFQQLDHVRWRGRVFWDLIQPSFMFLVGVSMPFSYSRRRARGDHWLKLFGHAVVRSLVLVGLAVFLASASRPAHRLFVHERSWTPRPRILLRLLLVLGRPPWFQLAAALLLDPLRRLARVSRSTHCLVPSFRTVYMAPPTLSS